jgi:diacylglycerol kinase (ATP)
MILVPTREHAYTVSSRAVSAERPTVSLDRAAEKRKRGLQRILDATHYSLEGLRAAWAGEVAFRQELVITVVLTPIALALPVALAEKILLIAVMVLVLVVELLNSAIEAAVDRDSLEINSLGKRAKDVGSAAVMMALALAGGTWLAIVGALLLGG